MTRSIMIQGAGSNVGKSLVVAGLARAYKNRGLSVAPFKPQNMSNNAAVTVDGGEIGRAQALQARAAGRDPVVDMNPVLLKPETDIGAQVIVQGKRFATLKARDYGKAKAELLPRVLESYPRLAGSADLVIWSKGPGSPAEINLRAGDIANMGFAEAADLPVVLVGDIDRGGVIAQLVGTHAILPAADRDRINGFIVNKFRGDVALFDDGRDSNRTAHRLAGPRGAAVVRRCLAAAGRRRDGPGQPARGRRVQGRGAPAARIANFDDLDPLAAEPGVTVEIIEPGRPCPAMPIWC